MIDLRIVFEPFPDDDLARFLEDNVIAHSFARTGVSEWHPLGFFVRNVRGEWLGGCMGYIWGGWLQIRWLWVTEALRGQGYGRRLMDAAEEMGVERGAQSSTLETHNPEALQFYRARGYEVFAALEDYPPGHSKFFLRKALTADVR